MTDRLRNILKHQGGMSGTADTLGDESDLFGAGLSSLATVNVMLAIEHEFGIEIPDELLTRRTFQTLGSLRKTVAALRAGVVVP